MRNGNTEAQGRWLLAQGHPGGKQWRQDPISGKPLTASDPKVQTKLTTLPRWVYGCARHSDGDTKEHSQERGRFSGAPRGSSRSRLSCGVPPPTSRLPRRPDGAFAGSQRAGGGGGPHSRGPHHAGPAPSRPVGPGSGPAGGSAWRDSRRLSVRPGMAAHGAPAFGP